MSMPGLASTSLEDTEKFKCMSNERLVTVNMFAFISGFAVMWIPYAVVSMWCTFGEFSDIPPLLQSLSSLFAKLSMVWSPVIFLIGYSRFRKNLDSNYIQELKNSNAIAEHS